ELVRDLPHLRGVRRGQAAENDIALALEHGPLLPEAREAMELCLEAILLPGKDVLLLSDHLEDPRGDEVLLRPEEAGAHLVGSGPGVGAPRVPSRRGSCMSGPWSHPRRGGPRAPPRRFSSHRAARSSSLRCRCRSERRRRSGITNTRRPLLGGPRWGAAPPRR